MGTAYLMGVVQAALETLGRAGGRQVLAIAKWLRQLRRREAVVAELTVTSKCRNDILPGFNVVN